MRLLGVQRNRGGYQPENPFNPNTGLALATPQGGVPAAALRCVGEGVVSGGMPLSRPTRGMRLEFSHLLEPSTCFEGR